MKYILSPVGTSSLINGSTDEQRKAVNHNANVKNKEAISREDFAVLERRIREVRQDFLSAFIADASRKSAEVNGICAVYKRDLSEGGRDFHRLLCTDTWLGETAAELAKGWLESQGLTVQVLRQADLQMTDLNLFQDALSNIVKWCDEEIRGYKESGYKIIFNLTGGFKSVQGFLQTLALFYADETVYIFETSDKLLRIPRLPVRLDLQQTVKENLRTIRRLSLNLPVDESELARLPETFLLRLGKEYTLSAWGEIVWKQTKEEAYQEKIYPSPDEKLAYGKNFLPSIESFNLNSERLAKINNQIDKLIVFLDANKNPNSLNVHTISGKSDVYEIYAWSDQDAKRFFGHYESGRFVLDRLGNHL